MSAATLIYMSATHRTFDPTKGSFLMLVDNKKLAFYIKQNLNVLFEEYFLSSFVVVYCFF